MDAAGISQVLFAWLRNEKEHEEGLNILNKYGTKIQAPASSSKTRRL